MGTELGIGEVLQESASSWLDPRLLESPVVAGQRDPFADAEAERPAPVPHHAFAHAMSIAGIDHIADNATQSLFT
eukprot:11165898-Lingulodinium_polyedra.AAC.1